MARKQVQRPEPAALVHQKRETKSDCAWLGVDVGLLLAGLVSASTLGAGIILMSTPTITSTSPTINPAEMRAHFKDHFLGVGTLLGWIPAGYLVGRLALAPALAHGSVAWGQAAAVKQLLGESRAVLPPVEQQRLYLDLYRHSAVAAGSAALCGGVVLGAMALIGLHVHAAAVAVFAFDQKETAAITLGCGIGAFIVTCCVSDIVAQTRTYAAQKWTECFAEPGSVFCAEGYHVYVDALVQKLDFVPNSGSRTSAAGSA
jgi:hypothetical protein